MRSPGRWRAAARFSFGKRDGATWPSGNGNVLARSLHTRRDTGELRPDAGWSALTAIQLAVEPVGLWGLVIELKRAGEPAPALVVDVPQGAISSSFVTIATPLGLAGDELDEPSVVEVLVRPAGSGFVPKVGLTASGDLWLAPEGIATPVAPEVLLAGQSLFDGAVVSLPSQAFDRRPSRRLGRGCGSGRGARNSCSAKRRGRPAGRIPGPSADPGTWTDSVIKTSASGEGLVFRVDAPWPILSASADAMVSVFGRGEPAAVAIDGSSDGETFGPLATFEPLPVVRQQHATGQLVPEDVTTSVWFTVDLLGPPATTGLNAVWFDLELAPPESALATLASMSSGELEVVPSPSGGGSTPSVTVDVAVEPNALEAAAWSANDAIRAIFSQPGPGLFLLLAAGLLAAAVARASVRRPDGRCRRSRPGPGVRRYGDCRPATDGHRAADAGAR